MVTTKTKIEEPTAVERVNQIEIAIEETREREKTIGSELAALEVRLASVLSEIEPDPARIEEIEEKRDDLAHELDLLDRRIAALDQSLPAARIQIDREELGRCVAAYPARLQEINEAVEEWREAAKGLTALAEAAKQVRERSWALQELSDKVRYLEVLLEVSEWTELAVWEHITEKESDAAREALQSGLELTRFPALSFRETQWWTKTEKLRSERSKAEAEARDRREYERQQRGGF
jgi:chromosome segregation ATPase